MELDRIDRRILRLMRNNARMPNKYMSERAQIAPSTALERVRKLHEAKVILGYHAEVAPLAIGIGLQAMVAIRMTRHSRDSLEAFQAHLRQLPEVLAFYHVAGKDDFLVHVGVRDTRHLRDFELAAFTQREEVAHIETHLIFEFRRNPELPIYAGGEPD
ncbi:MAG: Lrp/AsnC family transcriptional regulator [Arenimonas sp.]|nr:Lrp/AsnC family transcriptional regulator [Arenimonas sp.]